MIMRRIENKTQTRNTEDGAAAPARRRTRSAFLAAVTSAAGLFLGVSGVQAQDSLGTWLTDDQKAKIELRECGANGLCSEIVWLKEPVDENGRPWRDENHPEASKRSRPIMGIDILKGTKKVEGNAWSGEIYDPEEGKHYYLKRIAVGADKVEIRGCLPAGWPCRTKYWTRTGPVSQPEPVVVAQKPQPAPAPAPVQQVQKPAPAPAPEVAQRPEPAPQPVQASMAPRIIPQAQARETAPAPQAQPQRQAQSVPVPDSRPTPPARAQAPQPQRQASLAQPQYAVTAPPPRPEPQPQLQPQAEERRWEPAWRQNRVASLQPSTTTGALPRQRAAAPVSAGNAYLVQVTAGQDQNEALRTFGKLQSRYPQLLGGYLPNIQKVDLGERGVWYRVRVGPMTQQTAAASFCQQLKAAGADCLIRRE